MRCVVTMVGRQILHAAQGFASFFLATSQTSRLAIRVRITPPRVPKLNRAPEHGSAWQIKGYRCHAIRLTLILRQHRAATRFDEVPSWTIPERPYASAPRTE